METSIPFSPELNTLFIEDEANDPTDFSVSGLLEGFGSG